MQVRINWTAVGLSTFVAQCARRKNMVKIKQTVIACGYNRANACRMGVRGSRTCWGFADTLTPLLSAVSHLDRKGIARITSNCRRVSGGNTISGSALSGSGAKSPGATPG